MQTFGISEAAAIAAFVVIVGCIIWLVRHRARQPRIWVPDYDYCEGGEW